MPQKVALPLLGAWLLGVAGVYDAGTLVHALVLLGLMLAAHDDVIAEGTRALRRESAIFERSAWIAHGCNGISRNV